MKDQRFLTLHSLITAARALAAAREISKCVLLFRLDPLFSTVGALNSVVRELCLRKHVDVASSVVGKIRDLIVGDAETYSLLVVGFCKAGDLVEAGKVWNFMMGEGMEVDLVAYEEIVVTMFKCNKLVEGMRVFKVMRERRFFELGISSYRIVIQWTCKIGRVSYAYMVFAEMLKRGLSFDSATVGHLIYGLLAKKRVEEAYKVLREAEEVDLLLCHGLMKGLLRMRRAAQATDVFREMVRRGIEPNMHTYIMLLQGHMGKRGRKGRDELVNFDSIFVGGLVKAGKTLDASKYAERTLRRSVEVPRFDYNKFLHLYSNEEGVEMFQEVGRRLKEVGMVDIGDVFLVYGERMATRERRRNAMRG